jgi:hypothetical protein
VGVRTSPSAEDLGSTGETSRSNTLGSRKHVNGHGRLCFVFRNTSTKCCGSGPNCKRGGALPFSGHKHMAECTIIWALKRCFRGRGFVLSSLTAKLQVRYPENSLWIFPGDSDQWPRETILSSCVKYVSPTTQIFDSLSRSMG